jgi:hypothetical protein
MAHANVSSGILTIIASFSNGLDVLRKLRQLNKKSPKRVKAAKRNDEDALRLSRSLRHGPEEIAREYQAGSMRCDSERYAMGDGRFAQDKELQKLTEYIAATAQNSLAEILLRLNTGLVSIIASFLDRDSKHGLDLDYKSLTDLSEASRVQTIGVLRQLYQRLFSKQVLHALPSARSNKEQPKPKAKKSSQHASPKHTKIRHPTLARVLIENSSVPSQIALVRPSENPKKHRPRSHTRFSSEPPRPHLRPSPAAYVPNLSTSPPPPPLYFPSDSVPLQEKYPAKQSRHHRSGASLNKPRTQLKHKPPTPLPSPLLNDLVPPIAHPKQTKPPINLRDNHLRPETFYSIASARTGSTKLGEIPMHKWAEPWDYEAAEEANQKALDSGWPVHVGEVTGDDNDDKKVKVGCWKRLFARRAKAS